MSTTSSASGFDIIDPLAVLPVLCSPGFYQRMKQLGGHVIAGRSKEEIEEAHQSIAQGTVKSNTWQYHYVTIISFCREYEKQVQEKKLVRRATDEEAQQLLEQQS